MHSPTELNVFCKLSEIYTVYLLLLMLLMRLSDNPAALERFKEKLQALAVIPEAEFRNVSNVMLEKRFVKGEMILHEGQLCKEFYFIAKGCIRSFCIKDGKEVNMAFYFEDNVVCDFESLKDETPATINFVAMENCVVYFMSRKDVVSFFLKDATMHMLLFRFYQYLFLREKQHSNSFKLMSAEERYQYLLDYNPKYIQRVPVIHLASYLGISRETLNRIRKKLN